MLRALQVSQPIKFPDNSKLLKSESRGSRSSPFLFNSDLPIFKLGFVCSKKLKIKTFSTVRDGVDSSALGLLELISNETQFDRVIAEARQLEESVVILWMASWCRKCIYLKPKLEKLATDYHPRVRFYCIDVNNVPHKLVVRAGVTKMPTVQLWKDCKKQGEVIGGHQAHMVVNEVREMIESEDAMMASCYRKCIYLKPKLERLAADYHPRVRFYCIDVNNVPHKLVVRAGVTKMPTVQLWKDSKKQGEVIGGHQAHMVVNEVREMIESEDAM